MSGPEHFSQKNLSLSGLALLGFATEGWENHLTLSMLRYYPAEIIGGVGHDRKKTLGVRERHVCQAGVSRVTVETEAGFCGMRE